MVLYAFLGSALLGALSTAFLLWRKARVEKDLVSVRAELEKRSTGEAEALRELANQAVAHADRVASLNAAIRTVRFQRDEAIELLSNSGAPGSIADLLRQRAKPKLPE